MGRLISSSGLSQHLIPDYFSDIQSQWIAKVEDVKCASVIGAFAHLTHDKFINALIKKNVGIVLSDSAYNRRIITRRIKVGDSFFPDEEYKGIRKSDLKGISEKNKDILDKTTNVEGVAFRFILKSQIRKDGDVDNTYAQPTLHAKMLGLVDKNGIVYEWLVGGHNPTLNGDDSIDCFTSITDLEEIDKFTDYWVYLWIESKILDRDKSPRLMEAINYKGKDKDTVMSQSWQNAFITKSVYIEDKSKQNNCNNYFFASFYSTDVCEYLREVSTRLYVRKISHDFNIPVGVKEEFLLEFSRECSIKFSIKAFFPISTKHSNTLVFVTKTRNGVYFHNLLKDHFFKWLDRHPRYKNHDLGILSKDKDADESSRTQYLEEQIKQLQEIVQSLQHR
jgi:hypothetical protein